MGVWEATDHESGSLFQGWGERVEMSYKYVMNLTRYLLGHGTLGNILVFLIKKN